MFVLDTNIVSELRKVRSGKANSGVASWAEQVPSAELFISAITIHELEHGVLLIERSVPRREPCSAPGSTRASPQHSRIEFCRWTSAFRMSRGWLARTGSCIVRRCFIAATALVHDMTVVTRDLKDFKRFDELDVINPWS